MIHRKAPMYATLSLISFLFIVSAPHVLTAPAMQEGSTLSSPADVGEVGGERTDSETGDFLWPGLFNQVWTPTAAARGDDGTFHLVTEIFVQGQPDIYYLHTRGDTLLEVTNLSEDAFPSINPDVEVLDGVVHAVWQAGLKGGDVLLHRMKSEQGWSPPEQLPAPAGQRYSPHLSVDPFGSLRITWQGDAGPAGCIWSTGHCAPAEVGVAQSEQATALPTAATRTIAFERDGEIYLVQEDGTGLRKVTSTGGRVSAFAWSPDGQSLAYLSVGDADNGYCDVYTIRSDGTGLSRLTSGINALPAVLDWSQDRITFLRDVDGDGSWFRLRVSYVTPAGATTDITGDLENWGVGLGIHSAPKLTWSPDGRWFALSHGTLDGIWSADGSVYHEIGARFRPDWRHDSGRLIASDIGIHSFDPATGARSLLSSVDAAHATYSPDDRYIAYSSQYLSRMNSDNTGHTTLAYREAAMIDWAPEGDKMAYDEIYQRCDGYYCFPSARSLYVINSDRSGERLLVQDDAFEPRWQPQSPLSISGHARYPDGSPIAGVTISDGVGHSTQTDTSGFYILGGLPAGAYVLTASLSGYTFTPSVSFPIVVPDVTEVNFTGKWNGTITDIEVNQVLGKQLNDNGELVDNVNLVAGKYTAVRVFLSAPVRVDQALQRVGVSRDGNPLTTLSPAETDGTQASTLTFLCHALSQCGSWQKGDYTFDAQINGLTKQESATFQERKSLRILAIPIKVNYNGNPQTPTDQWKTGGEFLRQVYPIAHDGLEWINAKKPLDATGYDLSIAGECPEIMGVPLPFNCTGRKGLSYLLSHQQPLSCTLPPNVLVWGCYDMIIGFLPPMPTLCSDDPVCERGCGCATGWSVGDTANVVMVDGGFRSTCSDGQEMTIAGMRATVAHEIGHALGLGDEYNDHFAAYQCEVNPAPHEYEGRKWGDPLLSCDSNYSCPDVGQEAWPGPGTGTGSKVSQEAHPFELLSTLAEDAAPRGALGDKLSYMGNGGQEDAWTTTRIYRHLFTSLVPSSSEKAAASAEEAAVLASGWIESDGDVVLTPWYRFSTVLSASGVGDYSIEAVDTISNTLASQRFDVSFVALDNPPRALDSAFFRVVVPSPAGATAFRVMHGDKVLRVIPVSVNAPTVTVTTPASGQVIAGSALIRWDSADLDGEVLYHSVEYSHNGSDWLVLGGPITERQLQVDFDTLPGGSQAVVRVFVTDGVNTGQATSATFTVGAKAPEVFLSSPGEGHVAMPGATLTLSGRAYDMQDGWLYDETSLMWSSSVDGVLGGGEVLNLKHLSVGKHTITLTATNSYGLSTSAHVHIYIGARVYLPILLRLGG